MAASMARTRLQDAGSPRANGGGEGGSALLGPGGGGDGRPSDFGSSTYLAGALASFNLCIA